MANISTFILPSNSTSTGINGSQNIQANSIVLPHDGTVLSITIACFALYIALLFVLRRSDEHNAHQIEGIVLPPFPKENCKQVDWYEVQFNTGEERCSGTTAVVYCKIICARGVSQVFKLIDPLNSRRKLFKTGSVTTFLLPLSDRIGDPEGIFLWHDNSGSDPCWFLRSVCIRDVLINWNKLFGFNNWLSLLQPGCRTFTFLSNEEISWRNVSQSRTWLILRHCLSNNHLWIGILFSSPLCRLRKTQRISCLLILIMVLMFVLTILYKDTLIVDTRPLEGLVCFIDVCIIWDDLLAVFKASAISWIVSSIFSFLFQYTEQEEKYICENIISYIFKQEKKETGEQEVLDRLSDTTDRKSSIDSECVMSPAILRRRQSCGVEELDVITLHPPIESPLVPFSKELYKQHEKTSIFLGGNKYSLNTFRSPLGKKLRQNSVSPFSGSSRGQLTSSCSITSFSSSEEESVHSLCPSMPDSYNVDQYLLNMKKYTTSNSTLPSKSENYKEPLLVLKKPWMNLVNIPKKLLKEDEENYFIPASVIYLTWFLLFSACIISSYMTYQFSDSWSNNTTKIWLICTILGICFDIFILQLIFPLVEFCRTMYNGKGKASNEFILFTTRNVWSNIQNQWNRVFKGDIIIKLYKNYRDFSPKIPKNIEKTKKKMKSKREIDALLYTFPYFFVLITVLLAVCYGNRDPAAYSIRGHLEDIFVHSTPFRGAKLSKVNDIPSVWRWLDTTFIPGLFNKSNYTLQFPQKNKQTKSLTDRVSVLIGVPRLRQIRVKKDSCKVAKEFNGVILECNDFYDWNKEAQSDSFIGWKEEKANLTLPLLFTHSPWKYMTGSQVNNSISVWGDLAVYRGGGYLVEMGRNLDNALMILQHLKQNQWLDKYSRALITEFTVYYPNINLIAYLIVTIDLLPNGLALRRHDMGILKLYRYLYTYQWGFFVCEVITLIFILYTCLREMGNIYRLGCKYFTSIWTLNQFAFVVSGIFMVGFYILREQYLSEGLKQFNEDHFRYISFYQIAVFDELIVYMLSVLELSAVLQFIHFLSFQKGITIILKTLGSAAVELGGFYSFIGVWIMGFSSYAFLKFVGEVEDFSKMTSTMRSLLSLLLGGLRYDSYRTNSPYMLAFLLLFILVMYLVVVNVFISIIQKYHSNISEEYRGVKGKYDMADVCAGLTEKLFGKRVSKYLKKKLKSKKRVSIKITTKFENNVTDKIAEQKNETQPHSGLFQNIVQELEENKMKKSDEKKTIVESKSEEILETEKCNSDSNEGKSENTDNTKVHQRKRKGRKRRKYKQVVPTAQKTVNFLSSVQTKQLNTAVNTLYSDLFAEDFYLMEYMLKLFANQTININIMDIKREFQRRKNLEKRRSARQFQRRFRGVSKSIIMLQRSYKRIFENRENINSLQAIAEKTNEEGLEVSVHVAIPMDFEAGVAGMENLYIDLEPNYKGSQNSVIDSSKIEEVKEEAENDNSDFNDLLIDNRYIGDITENQQQRNSKLSSSVTGNSKTSNITEIGTNIYSNNFVISGMSNNDKTSISNGNKTGNAEYRDSGFDDFVSYDNVRSIQVAKSSKCFDLDSNNIVTNKTKSSEVIDKREYRSSHCDEFVFKNSKNNDIVQDTDCHRLVSSSFVTNKANIINIIKDTKYHDPGPRDLFTQSTNSSRILEIPKHNYSNSHGFAITNSSNKGAIKDTERQNFDSNNAIVINSTDISDVIEGREWQESDYNDFVIDI